DEYYLERSPVDQSNFAALTPLSGATANYDDAGVTAGITYYYRVRGRQGGAYSPWSNVASGILALPNPPVLSLTENAGDETLDLSWVNGESDYDAVYLERSEAGGAYAALAT